METQKLSPYKIAAGMLASDAKLLLLLYPILIVPVVLELWFEPNSLSSMAATFTFDRGVQLFVFSIIGIRWARKLHTEGAPPSTFSVTWRIFLVGFLIWACVIGPLLLGMWADADWSFIIGLCLLAPGTAFAFRHFFYFVPILIGVRSLSEIQYEARQITTEDRFKPFKVLMAPFAIMCLLSTLAIAPAPDGRSLLFTSLSSVLTGIFWILSIYIGLAFGFSSVSLSRWRAHHMEPYRDERFDTIALRANPFVAKMLTGRTGFRILAVALFLMLGNYTRSATMLPSPHVALGSVRIEDNVVRVHLTLTDPDYHFRGFSSVGFMLAGETGVPVSNAPPKVIVENDGSVTLDPSLVTPDKMSILVEFSTDRKSSDLEQLEDLWLWYKFVKLFPIPKQALQSKGNYISEKVEDPKPVPGNSRVDLRSVKLIRN